MTRLLFALCCSLVVSLILVLIFLSISFATKPTSLLAGFISLQVNLLLKIGLCSEVITISCLSKHSNLSTILLHIEINLFPLLILLHPSMSYPIFSINIVMQQFII